MFDYQRAPPIFNQEYIGSSPVMGYLFVFCWLACQNDYIVKRTHFWWLHHPEAPICLGDGMFSRYCKYMILWRFPKMGAPPPNHPWINGIFHYKLSSYWGTPTVGNLQIVNTQQYTCQSAVPQGLNFDPINILGNHHWWRIPPIHSKFKICWIIYCIIHSYYKTKS